jgi:hypothetical protein
MYVDCVGFRVSGLGPFIWFVDLAYYQGQDIMFRFIIEYSSLRDFYRPLGDNNNNNRSIFYTRIFER